jgi:hypothetical protein
MFSFLLLNSLLGCSVNLRSLQHTMETGSTSESQTFGYLLSVQILNTYSYNLTFGGTASENSRQTDG